MSVVGGSLQKKIRAGIAGVRIDDQPIEGKRATQTAGVEVKNELDPDFVIMAAYYARDAANVGFFFQAEDGIRDGRVTGVQTCALPICWRCVSGCRGPAAARRAWTTAADRKSVVQGQSVDLGGRRIIKKKKRGEQG